MPASPAAFRAEQRRVAAGMALALLLTLLVAGWGLTRAASGPAPDFPTRIAGALRADIAVLAWLAAAIGNVARLRFFSPQDIAGSAAPTVPSRAVIEARAVLQNTLEQALLAIGTHCALAAALARPAPLIPALVALFCLGRLCFWLGYAKGAAARAFGFAITFYPSLAGLLVAAAALVAPALAAG